METASWETTTAMAKQTSQVYPNVTRGTRTPSQIQIIGVPYIYIYLLPERRKHAADRYDRKRSDPSQRSGHLVDGANAKKHNDSAPQ